MEERLEICIARNIIKKFWQYRGYANVEQLTDRDIAQMYDASKCITIKMHNKKISAIIIGVDSEEAAHIEDLRKIINAQRDVEKCILIVGKKFIEKSNAVATARTTAAARKIEIEIIHQDAVSAIVPEHAEYATMSFRVVPPDDVSLRDITVNVKNISPISINDPLLVWRGDAKVGHVLVIDTPSNVAGHSVNYRYIAG